MKYEKKNASPIGNTIDDTIEHKNKKKANSESYINKEQQKTTKNTETVETNETAETYETDASDVPESTHEVKIENENALAFIH